MRTLVISFALLCMSGFASATPDTVTITVTYAQIKTATVKTNVSDDDDDNVVLGAMVGWFLFGAPVKGAIVGAVTTSSPSHSHRTDVVGGEFSGKSRSGQRYRGRLEMKRGKDCSCLPKRGDRIELVRERASRFKSNNGCVVWQTSNRT